MNNNKPSVTSLMTTFGRAYHSQFDKEIVFDDNIAKEFFSNEEYNEIRNLLIKGFQYLESELVKTFQDNPNELLKSIIQIQLAPTTLSRSAYCEKVLLNEQKLGIQQYLILGAGFDTFCFRHPEAASNLQIFEIDHPATQHIKKQKLKRANIEIPDYLHFVEMDFTSPIAMKPLVAKGFKMNKTFISLLGVSYYLSKEDLASLLRTLFAKLPTGSSIVLDYADEGLFEVKGRFNRVENMVKMAAASGEPMKACYTYHELERLLQSCGLLIYEHLTPAMIQDLYFHHRNDYLSAFETIHYIHAVKK
ncbi:class I SAM-dependent methyltransferase [Metabacillus malikii]|uniref:S-adenosyl-L-methionine-dependent methyltransferase n=1 Tax=Metabacillus malikii TaxID=1504265 RepID=A0ABT9ZC04_9BACI|nr:SAM-dependent methyltransferase [Metabacillus malikii]MDQ0229372.1 methyltransferase (TIGR00027 family) [Metabacillus malikii]